MCVCVYVSKSQQLFTTKFFEMVTAELCFVFSVTDVEAAFHRLCLVFTISVLFQFVSVVLTLVLFCVGNGGGQRREPERAYLRANVFQQWNCCCHFSAFDPLGVL